MNHPDEIQERINWKIASAAVAYMSDAKWRKLFNALVSYSGNIHGLYLKFVNDERILLLDSIPGPYKANELGFRDEMPSPYIPFREIDFVLIPNAVQHPKADLNRPLPDLSNDIASIILYLENIAKFPIQNCVDGSFKILGYEWSN
ncbi:hypothetical protein [Acaryochloris sp. CCMEE 5410]|uniref:hypothetical protein n=1 Tax=Acaryochloris sp. CCMEE 5410 TaxID=310037 RepID=UPI0011127947|nr:hypothetical protein [Acaryochloris sp. CCMEE 5410]KAI9130682.1 hypothetical protein ON05_023230 [Acaryochloris sp. CCMEE 5410]